PTRRIGFGSFFQRTSGSASDPGVSLKNGVRGNDSQDVTWARSVYSDGVALKLRARRKRVNDDMVIPVVEEVAHIALEATQLGWGELPLKDTPLHVVQVAATGPQNLRVALLGGVVDNNDMHSWSPPDTKRFVRSA